MTNTGTSNVVSSISDPPLTSEYVNADGQIILISNFYYPNHLPASATGLDCGDELITKQSHKAECDINTIYEQYTNTGNINHLNARTPDYLDLPDSIDYQESYNLMLQANEAFASLPSRLRDYYKNDPSTFLQALSDPNERDRLVEFGVLNKPPSPPPAAAGEPSAPVPPA